MHSYIHSFGLWEVWIELLVLTNRFKYLETYNNTKIINKGKNEIQAKSRTQYFKYDVGFTRHCLLLKLKNGKQIHKFENFYMVKKLEWHGFVDLDYDIKTPVNDGKCSQTHSQVSQLTSLTFIFLLGTNDHQKDSTTFSGCRGFLCTENKNKIK